MKATKQNLTKEFHEMTEKRRKDFYSQKCCMAYDNKICTYEIIYSHIISKKYLKNIATDGHVYTTKTDSSNKIEFKKLGINKAKSFTASCFCKNHDNVLFKSFEEKDFAGEYNQIYDLSFRALCREFFQKKSALKTLEAEKSRALYYNHTFYLYAKKRLQTEIRDHKFLYEQLKNYKNKGLEYLLIKTSKIPISATGIHFPLYDFTNKKIQNEKLKQLGFIYNILSLNDYSYILVATVKNLHNELHKSFLESIKGDLFSVNRLIALAFFTNDSIAIAPNWYENISNLFKENLAQLMNIQSGSNGSGTRFYGYPPFVESFEEFKVHNIKRSSDLK